MASHAAGRPGRATLNEVAAQAGVSPTTASLVLGGKASQHRISEETYRRVQQAADALDYAPNLLVRSMQRGRTHIVSFFNAFRHRLVNDLYMDRLSTAIENAGGRHGYDILVHCDFSRPPEETYRLLNGARADGLLFFAPLPGDPLFPLLRASRLPVVLINAQDEAGLLSSVKDDVESGMHQVAETLLALGHRRVAMFTEEGDDFRDAKERIGLLRTRLQAQGAIVPDRWIVPWERDGQTALRRWMGEPEPPTALFCWRDRLSYYVLEACDLLGLVVPDQLSVLSYDGLPWPAATRHTAASVHVDLDALAEAALRLLDQRICGQAHEVISYKLPVVLTPGTTLGPPGGRP